MNAYEHRQPIARWMVVAIAMVMVAIIIAVMFATPPGGWWVLGLVAVVTIVATWMFSSMTSAVDAAGIRWWLTWGWPAGHIAFDRIERVEMTTLNLMEVGKAGIGWTPWHGWLWRVAGSKAVEIFTTGGGRTTLATDDPQGLLDAIERFRRGAA
jgi:hypothetical protein